jgi:hypothetical protein
VNNEFKNLIWDTAVKFAISKLIAAVPFLSAPFLSGIISMIVFKVADVLFEKISLIVDLKLIVFRSEKLQKAYTKAALNLRELGEKKGVESMEYMTAREEHREALSKLVSLSVV